MNKIILTLFGIAVFVNFVFIIYTVGHHSLHWMARSTRLSPSRIDQILTTDSPSPENYELPIPHAAVKYDLDMHANYRLQVLKKEMERIAKIPGCSEVMANPMAFWRSQASTNFTADVDLDRLKMANKCFMILIADYIKTPPRSTLYRFEVPFVEEPPVTDLLRVSNESTSSVVLLNSSSQFVLGDTVALLITMRDGNGNLKGRDGDEIRVWFTDTSDSKSVLPAKVTDLENGTYLAHAVLAFVGTLRATVALAYSREYFQYLFLVHLMMKSTTTYLGAFRNSIADETTVCSHIPVIPGVDKAEICNVSVTNGSPWFCGRPVKPWLACSDYAHTSMLPLIATMPMSEVEKPVIHRENKIRLIGGSSHINVQVLAWEGNKGLSHLLSSVDCNTVPARRTWEQTEPTGYLYKGVWKSYLCRHTGRVTNYCLNDLQILILGDSNSRAHYNRIAESSQCKEQIKQEYRAWHKSLKCVNRKLNFNITWLPHSNPFKTSVTSWAGLNWITASNVVIDQIPSTGLYLVILNHYLHVTSSHISAYIEMMTAIKESLIRLLKRNPNVFVVLQGPHILWYFGAVNTYHMGDALRRYYIAIQYEIFKDLRDRIFYVPTTDMTISIVNNLSHPPINSQITDFITGFYCGRH